MSSDMPVQIGPRHLLLISGKRREIPRLRALGMTKCALALFLRRQLFALRLREIAQLFLAHRFRDLFRSAFSDDFERSPRFAASAAPAAICCFFDLDGIKFIR